MKAGRKLTGGRYKKVKKKKKTDMPGQNRVVKIGERKVKFLRGRGGNKKTISFKGNVANVNINGKSKNVKILKVIETPSNIFLARQNVLVKGAIIDTEIGKAKITNRPSKEGQIQAILIEKKD
ncbi:MAG: 30S ribosomal protein S8e [Candidatus Pacearchaeota archaeon]